MIHLVTWFAPLLEASAGEGGAPGAAGPLGACGGGGTTQMFIMMGLVFFIFYFLIIRPGQKREKERQALLAAIKPGDQVVTAGGILGKVTGTTEKTVTVEISPKVRVRVLRSQISGKDEGTESDTQKSGRKNKGKKQQGDQGNDRTPSSDGEEKGNAES